MAAPDDIYAPQMGASTLRGRVCECVLFQSSSPDRERGARHISDGSGRKIKSKSEQLEKIRTVHSVTILFFTFEIDKDVFILA